MKDRKTVIFLANHIDCGRNRTQFQRAKMLAISYNVYMLLAHDTCSELKKLSNVKLCPGSRWGLHLLIYPFWAFFNVLVISGKHHVSLVYTSYYPQALLTGATSKVFHFKWVADIWDSPTLPYQRSKGSKGVVHGLKYLSYFVAYQIVRVTLRKADLIILALEVDAIRNYNINIKKVVHVTNGIDMEYMQEVIDKLMPKAINLKKDRFVLVYVGYLSRDRGIDLILEAADRLQSKGIFEYHFNLIGDSNDYEMNWLLEQIDHRGLHMYIRLLGRLNHHRTLEEIANADICLFLFPAKEELRYIYPIKIFEYMAMGKPIIATNLNGIRKILSDKHNALLVSDITDLVDAIFLLFMNEEMRYDLGHHAHDEVWSYDWRKINNVILSELNSFIGD